VDYEARARQLGGLACPKPGELIAGRKDGRIKMHVMHRGLQARARFRELFERGEYGPLDTTGARQENVFAFARRLGDEAGGLMAIPCVPRLVASLMPDGITPPLGPAVWRDTRIAVPTYTPFHEVFTGTRLEPELSDTGWSIAASTLFDRF